MKNIIEKLLDCIENSEDVALVTITKMDGSGPRHSGSMMLVSADGKLLSGTIGGGGIEKRAINDATKAIKKRESISLQYNLTPEGKNSVGMICGGSSEVFIKVFSSSDRLIVVGGGHIGYELTYLASYLGYSTTVIDHRPEFSTPERFPHADKCICGNVKEELEKIEIRPSDSIVIITHGHKFDYDAISTVINSDARYMGMIGSRTKVKATVDKLAENGFKKATIKKIHAPIGLDIGGESPKEISIAILAEIQAVKYGRKAGFISRG